MLKLAPISSFVPCHLRHNSAYQPSEPPVPRSCGSNVPTARIGPLFGADRLFRAAVMTMFVLPPPFVAPLFMQGAATEDRAFVVNTLSLATVVTLAAFTAVSVFYP